MTKIQERLLWLEKAQSDEICAEIAYRARLRIDELEGIVAKLPVTEDGVRVLPDDDVFVIDTVFGVLGVKQRDAFKGSRFWFARAAAEAAAKEKA